MALYDYYQIQVQSCDVEIEQVLYLQGDYAMAVEALNRGYSLDEGLLADRDFMVAGIRAYTELERFDIATGLLAAMLKSAGFQFRTKMATAGLIDE